MINGKLTYTDVLRLSSLVVKSNCSQKYKLDLIEGLLNLKT